MKVPDKIYLDKSKITENGFILDAIVPDGRVEVSDVCYICKDVLLKLLREKRKAITECSATDERKVAALSVIDFLIDKIELL